MNLEERIFTKLFMNETVILEKRQIAEKAFHFKLGGDIQFSKIAPGQHLRLLLYPNQGSKLRDRVRTYSIWDYQQLGTTGTLDIAICTDSEGPGSQWAMGIEVNSKVLISNPLGKFTLDKSKKNHIFIGDVTTLAHFYCFLRHLTDKQSIHGMIYGDNRSKLFPDLDGSRPFAFFKSPSDNIDSSLLDYCRHLEIHEDTMVYIAGEGNTCVLLHNLFVKEQGISRKQIKVKPFWAPNKTGLE